MIYSKVLASSTVLLNNVKYTHGFAVIPKELTGASGRGSNQVIETQKVIANNFNREFHSTVVEPTRMLDVLPAAPYSVEQQVGTEDFIDSAFDRNCRRSSCSQSARLLGK